MVPRLSIAVAFAMLTAATSAMAGAPSADPASVILPNAAPAPTGLTLLNNAPGDPNSNGFATNHGDGLDQKWGDPLYTDLIQSDTLHARVNYFVNSGHDGSQGGLIFSITIPTDRR
jgi:hypothetical protein